MLRPVIAGGGKPAAVPASASSRPRTTPRRPLPKPRGIRWEDICVEHLDLDQFDNRGRLIGSRYRPLDARHAGEGR